MQPKNLWNSVVWDQNAVPPATPPAVPPATPPVTPPATPPATPPVEPPKPPAEPPKTLVSEPPPVPFTPLTIKDLTLPEGVALDDKLSGKFLEVVNDQKLTPKDRAQALVNLQLEAATAASERNSTLWKETQDGWKEEAKALPEIGGAKLPETLADIRKLLDTYGSAELDGVLDLTGAGNNPHVIKFLHKLAKAHKEGGPLIGGPTNGPKDAAAILYPNQGKQ